METRESVIASREEKEAGSLAAVKSRNIVGKKKTSSGRKLVL
jgi:hypothetical protein